jgi:hypothetical protein
LIVEPPLSENPKSAEHRWLKPVILATQEAEIRKIVVGSQPKQIVHKTLSQKYPSKQRAGGVAQAAGSEFKPQHHKKKKRKEKKKKNLKSEMWNREAKRKAIQWHTVGQDRD